MSLSKPIATFNFHGFYTLLMKEVWRFMKVMTQTVLTPMITVLLYLLIFSSVLSEHVEVYAGVSYSAFLVPGLIIFSVLQNAFSNTSSSLFQARQNGNVLFVLLAPLSSLEFYLAYVLAAAIRGLLVGVAVWFASLFFVDIPIHNPGLILLFALLGSVLLGALGLMSAVWAKRWDHIAAFQNFVILPLSFLSGVFYSIQDLPPMWSELSYYNPFFYLIDGFRYSFLGVSDASVGVSLLMIGGAVVVTTLISLRILDSGYNLRE